MFQEPGRCATLRPRPRALRPRVGRPATGDTGFYINARTDVFFQHPAGTHDAELADAVIVRARVFYAGVGFGFDERFCDADSLMVGVSHTIHLIILGREKFATFSPRPLAPEGTVGALVALSQPSAEAVIDFVARALAHGGTDNAKTQEAGDFMYGRSVSDLDGNVLEIMWMDVERAMKAWGQAAPTTSTGASSV